MLEAPVEGRKAQHALIEILISTYDPTRKVNGRASTQAFPPRMIDFLALQLCLKHSFIPPVQGWLFEGEGETIRWNEVRCVFIISPSLEKAHRWPRWGGGKSCRDNTSACSSLKKNVSGNSRKSGRWSLIPTTTMKSNEVDIAID
jgi:hypothetical protein